MEYIDYNDAAGIYDIYAEASYDFKFFTSRIVSGERVLELTSGTGRLSIPLIRAGAQLACVDISQGMLDVLKGKLTTEKLKAEILCADIQHLPFETEFNMAILPFQSFMELAGRKRQLTTLRSVCQTTMV